MIPYEDRSAIFNFELLRNSRMRLQPPLRDLRPWDCYQSRAHRLPTQPEFVAQRRIRTQPKGGAL